MKDHSNKSTYLNYYGYINAGYAIWREFSAELFAMDLDDDCTPFSINEVKKYIRD